MDKELRKKRGSGMYDVFELHNSDLSKLCNPKMSEFEISGGREIFNCLFIQTVTSNQTLLHWNSNENPNYDITS